MAIERNLLQGLKAELREKLNLSKIPRRQLELWADDVVKSVKDNVRKGISPIGTGGRLPSYKNPSRYPGKRKSPRPVNLKLTSRFLADLKSRIVLSARGFKVLVGFRTQSEIVKEEGHRDGAGGQPKRPVIPLANEDFSRRIRLRLERSLKKILP